MAGYFATIVVKVNKFVIVMVKMIEPYVQRQHL